MRKKFFLSFILLCYIMYCQAQSYDWVKGGGSTEGMNPAQSSTWEKVTNMCTDTHGNVYTTSVVGSSDILADTFHLLSAHNTGYSQYHVLVSSYKCDGTMRWSKLLECSSGTLIGRTYLGFMNGSITYSNGSIYIAGAFDGYSTFCKDDCAFFINFTCQKIECMKKISLIYLMVFSNLLCNAQSYRWIKGGGSTESMTPSRNYETVKNMCTDERGNIYITSVVGATNILADTFSLLLANDHYSSIQHVLLASYKCDGTIRWAKLIESSDASYCGFYYANNNGIAYNNGSIYVVGEFDGYTKWIDYDTTFNSNTRSFTARFDTSGQLKWMRFIGPDSPSTFAETAYAGVLAIDGQGYIHNFAAMKGGVNLIPLSFVTDTTPFVFTYDLKYDSSGNLISANKVYFDSLWLMVKTVFNKQDNKYYSILTPNESYWYSYHSSLSWNSALCAFSPSGHIIWEDTTGVGGTMRTLDYKGGNAIYASGISEDTFSFGGIGVSPHGSYVPIFKLDTNGLAVWNYCLYSDESVNNSVDLTILPNKNLAVVGQLYGVSWHGTDTIISTPGEMSNPLLLIVDSSGHTVRQDQFHGSGNDDAATCITSDAVGNIYVGGMLEINMSATGLTPYPTHGGNTDFFVVKYGYNCACTAMPASNFTRTGSPTASFTYTGSTTGKWVRPMPNCHTRSCMNSTVNICQQKGYPFHQQYKN